MVAVKEADLFSHVKRAASSLSGVLLYGDDEAQVQSLARTLISRLGKPEDVVRLSAGSLRGEESSLRDRLSAMNFFGDRQVIVVDGADDVLSKRIADIIEGPQGANLLVLVAGSLSKGSHLRASCEASPHFVVTPLYADTPAMIYDRVVGVLRAAALQFDPAAGERFMLLCGTDRALALGEAEKLALYCHGQTTVTVEDVSASCGDQSAHEVDALIDVVLSGDLATSDRMLHAMDDSDVKSLLPLLNNHLVRLLNLRVEADRAGSVEAAVRAARPPVFFNRKSAISRQLQVLDVDDCHRLILAVEQATLASRRQQVLEQQIVARLCFSLAAEVQRSLRQR